MCTWASIRPGTAQAPSNERALRASAGSRSARLHSVSILPFRFDATGLFAGEIYWDDLCVYQVADNPCAADVNGDGVLDNGDIGAFVQLFLASDLAADFNDDGILDNGDIGAFVQAFLAGCS